MKTNNGPQQNFVTRWHSAAKVYKHQASIPMIVPSWLSATAFYSTYSRGSGKNPNISKGQQNVIMV
jgi:hypothetical protein